MSVRERLERDLKQAMKERNRPAVSAIKSALSAIDNAGAVAAVPVDSTAPLGPAGFAPDVPRRELTEDEIVALVRAEADELRAAAEEYEGYGKAERAQELRSALRVLAPYTGAA